MEAGLINKWYSEIMDKPSKVSGDDTSSKAKPLSLDNLQGPFLILGFGLAMAIILFMGEKLC